MNDLKEFYDNKYIADRAEEIRDIRLTNRPTNRFENCLHYFTTEFAGESILELGAGNGTITKAVLRSNSKVQRFKASDLSENRLVAIKEQVKDDRLSIQQIDVENFDFSSLSKFDGIIMVALIEHLIDPIRALKQIRAVLNPGGVIYIDTPNVADFSNRIKLLRGKFPSTASREEGLVKYDGSQVDLFDEGHLHYFTFKSLSRMLTTCCGYSSVKYVPYASKRVIKGGLGIKLHDSLAKSQPGLFSSLSLVGYN